MLLARTKTSLVSALQVQVVCGFITRAKEAQLFLFLQVDSGNIHRLRFRSIILWSQRDGQLFLIIGGCNIFSCNMHLLDVLPIYLHSIIIVIISSFLLLLICRGATVQTNLPQLVVGGAAKRAKVH